MYPPDVYGRLEGLGSNPAIVPQLRMQLDSAFGPFGRNQQGVTCNAVKKQMIHDVRGRHKFGNDLAKSLEKGTRNNTEEELWAGMGSAVVTLKDPDKLTPLEVIDTLSM